MSEANTTYFDILRHLDSIAKPRGPKPGLLRSFDYDEAMRLFDEDVPLEEIGAKFGVSRERIRQIAKMYGKPPRNERRLAREQEMVEFLKGGATNAETIQKFGITEFQVQSLRKRYKKVLPDPKAEMKRRIAKVVRDVKNGRSIRSAAFAHGFKTRSQYNALMIHCRNVGVTSRHGPWGSMDHRFEMIPRLRAEGLTWDQITDEIGKREQKPLKRGSVQAWWDKQKKKQA